MWKYEIGNPILSTYLSARFQEVSITDFLSQACAFTRGGKLGNVFVPILLLLNVIDISDVVRPDTPFLLSDVIEIVYPFENGSINPIFLRIIEDLVF